MDKELKEQFQWMVAPTTAKAWGAGGGLMVWLSVACGLVGAGGYIASALFGNFMTLLISWLIVTVLKNFVHFLHMNKKSRVFSMANGFNKAWIARGTVFTAAFSALGLIQLLVMYFAPAMSGVNICLEVLTCLAAAGIIVYEVCLLASNRAIPFWQGAMVPVTFTLWAVLCGLTLVLGFNPDASNLLGATLVAVIALALAMIFSLWAATKEGDASGASVAEIVSGSLAALFWFAAVVIGLCCTGVIVAVVMFGLGSNALCIAAWACAIVGTLGYTLCIFKAAKYRSLI